MVSSLGLDASSSCAAARAGLTRLTPLGYEVHNEKEFEMVPVSGHSIGSFAEGYVELGRLVRLGAFAMRDLIATTAMQTTTFSRTAIMVNLASDYHESVYKKHMKSEMSARESVARLNDDDISYSDLMPWYKKSLVKNLLQFSGVSEAPHLSEIVFMDQPGVMRAVSWARERLDSGSVDCCIIGGIDSLLEYNRLKILDTLGLLKTPLRSVGLIPGEGAAFLRLETLNSARARGATSLALIGAENFQSDTNTRFSGRPPDGQVIAHTAISALKNNKIKECEVIVDINGDPFRSQDWGNAIPKISTNVNVRRAVIPAESFGDTCAAFGFIGACMAVSSFQRHYHSCEATLIWAASDAGAKGSFLIHAGGSNV